MGLSGGLGPPVAELQRVSGDCGSDKAECLQLRHPFRRDPLVVFAVVELDPLLSRPAPRPVFTTSNRLHDDTPRVHYTAVCSVRLIC